MSKKIILICAGLMLLSLAAAHGALAADTVKFIPEITIPGSDFLAGQEKVLTDNTSLICDYIIAIYKYGIAIIGIVAVVAIAFGGAIWILSAGSSSRIADGKSWVTGGLLGLVLALGSFIILATINDQLVTCQITNLQVITDAPLPKGIYYPKESQQAHVITERQRLDRSGQYKCCVIEGKPTAFYYPFFPLTMVCSGVHPSTNPNECPDLGTIVWKGIKRCVTYEAADTQKAQGECDNFYAAFNCYDSGLKMDCRFKSQSSTTGDELWSAAVYNGKCWENTETKNWCKGQ